MIFVDSVCNTHDLAGRREDLTMRGLVWYSLNGFSFALHLFQYYLPFTKSKG